MSASNRKITSFNSIVLTLMSAACGKAGSAHGDEQGNSTLNISISDSSGTEHAQRLFEYPQLDSNQVKEFLPGFVVYKTPKATHVEGFRLIPSLQKTLFNDVEVQIDDPNIDTLVVKLMIPEAIDGLVGRVQNAKLLNSQFVHVLKNSELKISRDISRHFITFTVFGLEFERLPKAHFATLEFDLATTSGSPLKTIQINCSFGPKYPKTR